MPPAFPRVQILGVGAISMATLDELRDARHTERAHASHLTIQAVELEALAEDHLADAGAFLVPRRAWWRVPGGVSYRLMEADRLAGLIGMLDRWTSALVPPRRGPIQGPGPAPVVRWGARVLAGARARAAARLRGTLVAVARAAAEVGVDMPDVGPLIDRAAELQARAEGLRAAAAAVASRLTGRDQEIDLREEAERNMGFDSLYLAAYFQSHGVPVVDSPIELDVDEVAHLAIGATSVATSFTGRRGADSGDDVPIAHTGIRHWVGAIRNRPVAITQLDPADSGVLVVSNRQLLFAGGRESAVIPLAGVVDIDICTDGIVVFRLGRESPHVFLVASPRQVAYYLNWALAKEMLPVAT